MGNAIVGLLFFVMILPVGCRQSIDPVSDHTYFLTGKVVDSRNGNGIREVLVGMRDPAIPDSVVFSGDSLRHPVFYVLMLTFSDDDGKFDLTWFPGARDTLLYPYLFGYKSGYRLWRYDREPVEVRVVNTVTDEMIIR